MLTSRKNVIYLSAILALGLASACIISGNQPTVDIQATVDSSIAATMQAPQGGQSLTPNEISPTEQLIEIPSPTNSPTVRNRIIIFYPYKRITKLSGLAFANNINLSTFVRDANGFRDALSDPDVFAAIYAPLQDPSVESLIQLNNFIDGGGRVFLFYNEYWADQNDTVQDLFRVSIAEETLIWGNGDGEVLVYDKSILPSWIGNSIIAVKPDYATTPSISSYIIIPEGSDSGEIKYANNDKTRIVYYNSLNKSTTFFPGVHEPSPNFNFDPQTSFFFDDDSINLGDNEQATLAMLNYLLDY